MAVSGARRRMLPPGLLRLVVPVWLALVVALTFAGTARASSYVASVGGKKYTSLQKAVSAAKKGQTVKLLKNVKTAQSVSFPTGRRITVALGKHRYVYTGSGKAFSVLDGSVTWTGGTAKADGVLFYVKKGASLTIKSGTYRGRLVNAGTCAIKGGTFVASAGSKASVTLENAGKKMTIAAASFDSLVNSGSGSLIIVSGKSSAKYCNNVIAEKGSVEIRGGSFSNSKYNNVSVAKGAKLVVRGGSFKAKSSWFNLVNYGTVTVKGGSFPGGIGTHDKSGAVLTVDAAVEVDVYYDGEITGS